MYLVRPIIPVFTTEYEIGLTGCFSSRKSEFLYNLWSGATKPRSDDILIIDPPSGFFEI